LTAAWVRKRFFLKKEARTFAALAAHSAIRRANGQKFFGAFFQERTASQLSTRLLRQMPPHPN
jgi:hypothetical protein